MVRVLDVLLHQLPVARNALAVVAQDGELAAIEQPVKVTQNGGAQEFLQRLHAVVKRRKHHAATGGHLELGQPMLCRVEIRRHAAIDLAILLHATPKRHALQVTRQGVVPLVVRAGQALAVAMPLAAKRHAPVGADVFHHMDRSILVTHQQHRALANHRALEIPRVGNLRLQANVAPVPVVEQTVQLLAVQRLIGIGLKGNAAGAIRLPADLLREHGHGAFMHGRLLCFLSLRVCRSIHQSFGPVQMHPAPGDRSFALQQYQSMERW